MNAVDAFSEVSKTAPYVMAAYGLLWASLAVYIGLIMRRLGHLQREVAVIEESVKRRSA